MSSFTTHMAKFGWIYKPEANVDWVWVYDVLKEAQLLEPGFQSRM